MSVRCYTVRKRRTSTVRQMSSMLPSLLVCRHPWTGAPRARCCRLATAGKRCVDRFAMCGACSQICARQSCEDFPVLGSIASAFAIGNGTLYSLSLQEIMDCCSSDSTAGQLVVGEAHMLTRVAWTVPLALASFRCIKNIGGLCTTGDYPNSGEQGQCRNSSCHAVVNVAAVKSVMSNNELLLQAAVAQQPVWVAVDASQASFEVRVCSTRVFS
jgi:hypothetical protein